jgi:hypothetical protein
MQEAEFFQPSTTLPDDERILISNNYKWLNMRKYPAQFISKYWIFHILWHCRKHTVLETLSARQLGVWGEFWVYVRGVEHEPREACEVWFDINTELSRLLLSIIE